MTLGEMIERAKHEPAEVKAGRRRAIVKKMQRIARHQRDGDLLLPLYPWGTPIWAETPCPALIDLGGEG